MKAAFFAFISPVPHVILGEMNVSMTPHRLANLLLAIVFLFPLNMVAQAWGVEFSSGYERRAIHGILDPQTFQARPLYLRQFDFAPAVWWQGQSNRFVRVRMQYGMLRGDAATFGEHAFYVYRDARMRNTTMIGGAVGGGWLGSWRCLDWRFGFEGGYAQTRSRLEILSQDPERDRFGGISETMSARLAELHGGCWLNLSLRLHAQFALGLEQRLAMRWMFVSGDIADDNAAYDGWGFTRTFPPQQVPLPRLWMSASF
jgi:hypothetical protein